MEIAQEAIVDSHVHFWDPDRLRYDWLGDDPILHRAFLPHAMPDTGGSVRAVIAVQADCEDSQAGSEVAWLQSLADDGAPIIGIVAHAQLERGSGAAAQVASHAAWPLVVGIRRLIQDEAAGFALHPDFVDGVRLLAEHRLAMDLCVRQHQIAEVTELVRRCPQVTFVLDHLGKPQLDQGPADTWAGDLARLAVLPNAYCKLSGLTSEVGADASSASNIPSALAIALDLFGASRCMFGSDWPVSSATITYADWLELVDAAVADLSATERREVMSETALTVYGRAERPLSMVES